jgi:hypothetical protein
MLKMSLFVCVGIVCSLMQRLEGNAASPPYSHLVLEIRPDNVWGKESHIFAVNEPVWISAKIRNTGDVPVSMSLDDEGVICRPVKSDLGKVTLMPSYSALDRCYRTVVLAPGKDMKMNDVLLGDFVRVSEKATSSFECSIECSVDLLGANSRATPIKTVLRLQFTGRLGDEAVTELVHKLRKHYDSGSQNIRTRMVKSTISIRPSESVSFLTKSITDSSEQVQYATLDVLSKIDMPKEQVISLLRQAQTSDKEAVRKRATIMENRLSSSH